LAQAYFLLQAVSSLPVANMPKKHIKTRRLLKRTQTPSTELCTPEHVNDSLICEEQSAPGAGSSTNTNVELSTPRPKKRKRGLMADVDAANVLDQDQAEASSAVDWEQKDKRGVVHLGNLPPMRVEKLRHLMEQFGEVGRIYLAPEDKSEQLRRKRSGGSRKLRYTEGWVEFAKKRIAKQVALSLNGTPIGGKKRHNYFRDDLWNIRYLPKFKWHQLKEGTIYNQHVRKARLEQKISQARRENDFFLENRERAKIRQKIAERQAARHGADASTSRFPVMKGKPKRNDPACTDDGQSIGGDISEQILDRLM